MKDTSAPHKQKALISAQAHLHITFKKARLEKNHSNHMGKHDKCTCHVPLVADNLMKTIIDILRTVYALIVGLLASIGIGVFAVLIFDNNRGTGGIIFTTLIGLFALFVGFQVYKTARRRGILNFAATVHASPDMDNLEPSENSEVRRVNVKEYVALVKAGRNLLKAGSIKIWGDWRGRNMEHLHEINGAIHEDAENMLQITFKDKSQVLIWNPQIITEASTYLKIQKADRIKWHYLKSDSEKYFDYFVENKRIKTETNSGWKADSMDILQGEPALLIRK